MSVIPHSGVPTEHTLQHSRERRPVAYPYPPVPLMHITEVDCSGNQYLSEQREAFMQALDGFVNTEVTDPQQVDEAWWLIHNASQTYEYFWSAIRHINRESDQQDSGGVPPGTSWETAYDESRWGLISMHVGFHEILFTHRVLHDLVTGQMEMNEEEKCRKIANVERFLRAGYHHREFFDRVRLLNDFEREVRRRSTGPHLPAIWFEPQNTLRWGTIPDGLSDDPLLKKVRKELDEQLDSLARIDLLLLDDDEYEKGLRQRHKLVDRIRDFGVILMGAKYMASVLASVTSLDKFNLTPDQYQIGEAYLWEYRFMFGPDFNRLSEDDIREAVLNRLYCEAYNKLMKEGDPYTGKTYEYYLGIIHARARRYASKQRKRYHN